MTTEKQAAKRDDAARVSLSDLRLGDEVVLRWTGYPGVPKSLSMSRATYLGLSGSRLRVQAQGERGTRFVRLSHIHSIVLAARPVMVTCTECDGDGDVQAHCCGCGVALTGENAEDDETCAECAREDGR